MTIRPIPYSLTLEASPYAPGSVVGKQPLALKPSQGSAANGNADRLTDVLVMTVRECTLYLYLFGSRVQAVDGELFMPDTANYLGRVSLHMQPIPGGFCAGEAHNLNIPIYSREAVAGYLVRPSGTGKGLDLGKLIIVKLCVEG